MDHDISSPRCGRGPGRRGSPPAGRARARRSHRLLPIEIWGEVMQLLDGASLMACRHTTQDLSRPSRDGALPGHQRTLQAALGHPRFFQRLNAGAERFVIDILAHMAAVRIGGMHAEPHPRREGRRLFDLVASHARRAAILEVFAVDLGYTAGRVLRERVSVARLRSLTLEYCGLNARGTEAVLSVSSLGDLQELNLSDNPCGDSVVRQLRHATHLCGLVSLTLDLNQITDIGLSELGEIGHLSTLARLSVGSNPIDSFAGLVSASALSSLQSLGVACSLEVDHVDLHELMRAPFVANLAVLDLEDISLGWGGGEVIARAPQLECLAHLFLSGCNLGPHGVWPITTSPHLSTLLILSLASNNIGDEGAFALHESRVLAHLEELDVGANGITLHGATCLATAQFIGPQLGRLDLRENLFSKEAFLAAVVHPELDPAAVEV